MGEKRRGTLERVPQTPQNFSRLIFCCPESVRVPGSGFFASCLLRCINGFLPLWCLKGGRAFLVADSPCLQLTFFPPSPRPPSRREGGDFRLFHARGFAPCIPCIKPFAALIDFVAVVPCGWLALFVAHQPCLQLAFLPLSPQPPSRREGGGIKVISCKGLRPLHPRGLNPRFAAKAAGSGSLRGCCLGSEAGVPGAVAPGEINF